MGKIRELLQRVFPTTCDKCGKQITGQPMKLRYTNKTLNVCTACAAEAMRDSFKDGSFGGFF